MCDRGKPKISLVPVSLAVCALSRFSRKRPATRQGANCKTLTSSEHNANCLHSPFYCHISVHFPTIMSGIKPSSVVLPSRDVYCPFQGNDYDEYTPVDSKEEERQLSYCDVSLSLSREEDPVQLYPRFDPSFDTSEQDQYSIQAACTFSSYESARGGDFVRESSCPSIPQAEESTKREKPTLRRSLAWSQDSLDERPLPKRCRRDDGSPTSLNDTNPFSEFHHHQQHHHRHESTSSLTAIHWEEKIVDSMQLVSFLDQTPTTIYHSKEASAF